MCRVKLTSKNFLNDDCDYPIFTISWVFGWFGFPVDSHRERRIIRERRQRKKVLIMERAERRRIRERDVEKVEKRQPESRDRTEDLP